MMVIRTTKEQHTLRLSYQFHMCERFVSSMCLQYSAAHLGLLKFRACSLPDCVCIPVSFIVMFHNSTDKLQCCIIAIFICPASVYCLMNIFWHFDILSIWVNAKNAEQIITWCNLFGGPYWTKTCFSHFHTDYLAESGIFCQISPDLPEYARFTKISKILGHKKLFEFHNLP
jgi:hypothetical protein